MSNPQRQDLKARSFQLAVMVFRLYPRMAATSQAHAWIARQLLRAVSSVAAQLEEGSAASSRRDMAEKYAIGLREAREANLWARLGATDPRWSTELVPVIDETREFVAMLTTSVKKLRRPQEEPRQGTEPLTSDL